MDNVATGLRPSLDEGLDWLQHAAIERSYTFTCLTKTMAPIANKLRNAA